MAIYSEHSQLRHLTYDDKSLVKHKTTFDGKNVFGGADTGAYEMRLIIRKEVNFTLPFTRYGSHLTYVEKFIVNHGIQITNNNNITINY